MNKKSIVVLLLLLIIGSGVYYSSSTNKSINSAENIGSLFVPGLLENLNNVSKMEVVGAGNQVISTLIRNDATWVVREKNNYPADISKIRASLLAIAEAKIQERKTSNPNLYSKLGVEDTMSENAQGIKVVIHDDQNKHAIIIGNPGPQINKTRYIRNEKEKASWLVDRKIDLNHDSAYWLRKDILSFEPDEVQAVTITLADGSLLEIANSEDEEKNKFIVTNLTDPESQVIDAELHQVTNALSSFQLLDIASDNSAFTNETKTVEVRYSLKNGINIDIVGYEVGQEHFVTLNISESESKDLSIDDDIKAEIKRLQAKTTGWIYKIPNVTYDSMYKREPDVLAITEDQLN